MNERKESLWQFSVLVSGLVGFFTLVWVGAEVEAAFVPSPPPLLDQGPLDSHADLRAGFEP